MNRLIPFVLFCMLAFSVSATTDCQREIGIIYGPYVSLDFIQIYFSPAHTKLSVATGCPLNMLITSSFQQTLRMLAEPRYAFYLAPTVYYPVLKTRGYRLIAHLKNKINVLLVVRKDSRIIAVSDLKGRQLVSHSPFAGVEPVIIDWLRQANIEHQVNRRFDGNLDHNLFKVLDGQDDAAVTISFVYNRLTEDMKKKLRVIKEQDFTASASWVAHSEAIRKYENAWLDILTQADSELLWDTAEPEFTISLDAWHEQIREQLESPAEF